MTADYTDPGTLRRLYHGEGLSLEEVGRRLGVSGNTVHFHMKEHGIERRGVSEAKLEKLEDRPHRDPEVLRRLYWDWGLSQPEVAEFLGVSTGVIQRQMRLHSVPRRDHGEAVEAGDGSYKDEETLRELYHGRHMSMQGVAEELGASPSTIQRWMGRLGLERRSRGESRSADADEGDEEWDLPAARVLWGDPGEDAGGPEWDRDLSAAALFWGEPEERDKRYRDPEVLQELYYGEDMQLREVAEELDTTTQTVLTWMRRHEIPRRRSGQHEHYNKLVEMDPDTDLKKLAEAEEGAG